MKWVAFVGKPYEAGFETSQPKLLLAPRSKIYASRKQSQSLSPAALELASKRLPAAGKPPRTSPECFALLYMEAERTLLPLHELAARIKKMMPSVEVLVAPLKGEARAAFKTLDKYDGDYLRLTDLARMTLKCASLHDANGGLQTLGADEDFELTNLKNRLMLEFDASATGGYRDALLVRAVATNRP